jgi:pyridoxal phosphate enzyme (YggS family)
MNYDWIRENLAKLRERIERAADRGGHRSDQVTLIAVSKTHPPEALRQAFAAGVRHFGENRVQEWEGKRGAVADLPGHWHLVGHLQSNKAARAARMFHSVDSLDDLRVAERLDRARAEMAGEPKLRVLIEVRVAPEETKSGVEREALPELAEKTCGLSNLELAGLMCIPPLLDDVEKVRPYFAELRRQRHLLEERLGRVLPVLSMGMSHDFEVAIAEGATEIRLGTAIFGERIAA